MPRFARGAPSCLRTARMDSHSTHASMSSPPDARGRRADLLTPEELASLGGLEFQARAMVEGALLGLHRSPKRGSSSEFAEHRNYRAGDEIRHVDWRMYARSDRYYVKQYQDETNLRAYILLDVSASMDWSSDPDHLPSKLHVARLLAAALALLLLRQGDRTGLGIFDGVIRDWLDPRGGRGHWVEVMRRLRDTAPGTATDPGDALRTAGLKLRRRGLVILLSDLLMEPDALLRPLGFLRHRGHQVVVLHLMDPGERDLGGRGQVRLRDPETGDELRADIGELRRRYRLEVDEAVARWRSRLGGAGVGHHLVDTGQPLEQALKAVLKTRSRMG
ncbi:MAG: DUF58 domain-containing protein [Gemmatimonadales bacterium]|nr:MAG: DUF58 domain-containing protein [Gemmatimonadales bacterium]